jgi:hypothetical protein
MYIALKQNKGNQLALNPEVYETGQFLSIRQNGNFKFTAARVKEKKGGGGFILMRNFKFFLIQLYRNPPLWQPLGEWADVWTVHYTVTALQEGNM